MPQTAFRLFDGEWSSDIPGYGGGHAKLFDDSRVRWFAEKCGGFEKKRVLELGPLEGGHTYMLAQRGAQVTAIESNTRAFLKCLIVNNSLDFRAKFMLGDFRHYLSTCSEKFDFLLASSVLYHMSEPAQLLQDAARVSDTIGIWTHYYDSDVINCNGDLRHKFDAEPRIETIGTRSITSYRQSYLQALEWSSFCGGSAPISYWLNRDSLLGLLDDLGFAVSISDDHRTHPNGPAMTLFAQRSRPTQT